MAAKSSNACCRLPSCKDLITDVEMLETRDFHSQFPAFRRDSFMPALFTSEDVQAAQLLIDFSVNSPGASFDSSTIPFSRSPGSLPSLFTVVSAESSRTTSRSSSRTNSGGTQYFKHGNSRLPPDSNNVNSTAPSFHVPEYQGPAAHLANSAAPNVPPAEISPRTAPMIHLPNPCPSNFPISINRSDSEIFTPDLFGVGTFSPTERRGSRLRYEMKIASSSAEVAEPAKSAPPPIATLSTPCNTAENGDNVRVTQLLLPSPPRQPQRDALEQRPSSPSQSPPSRAQRETLEQQSRPQPPPRQPRQPAQPQREAIQTQRQQQKEGYPANWKCSYEEGCSLSQDVLPRKVVSHFFGRNKLPTKRIPPELWVYYCRQHYQRMRYRLKAQNSWHMARCNLLWQQLEAFIQGMGEIRWTIQWVSSSQDIMRKFRAGEVQSVSYNPRSGANPDATTGEPGESSSSKRKRASTAAVSSKRRRTHRRSRSDDGDDDDDDNDDEEAEVSAQSGKDDDDRKISQDELDVAGQLDRLCGQNQTNAQVREFLRMAESFLREEKVGRLLPFEFLPVRWGEYQ